MCVARIDPRSLVISIGWNNRSDIRLIMKKSRNKYAEIGARKADIGVPRTLSFMKRLELAGHNLQRDNLGCIYIDYSGRCFCGCCDSTWVVHEETYASEPLERCEDVQKKESERMRKEYWAPVYAEIARRTKEMGAPLSLDEKLDIFQARADCPSRVPSQVAAALRGRSSPSLDSAPKGATGRSRNSDHG